MVCRDKASKPDFLTLTHRDVRRNQLDSGEVPTAAPWPSPADSIEAGDMFLLDTNAHGLRQATPWYETTGLSLVVVCVAFFTLRYRPHGTASGHIGEAYALVPVVSARRTQRLWNRQVVRYSFALSRDLFHGKLGRRLTTTVRDLTRRIRAASALVDTSTSWRGSAP